MKNKNLMNAIAAWLWGFGMIGIMLFRNSGVEWRDVRISHLITIFVGIVLVIAGFVYLVLALRSGPSDGDRGV